jgi:hypothetical protein
MYNLLMFYQYSYATCFDHNFGHHHALNEHISGNQTHWIQLQVHKLSGGYDQIRFSKTHNLDKQEKQS